MATRPDSIKTLKDAKDAPNGYSRKVIIGTNAAIAAVNVFNVGTSTECIWENDYNYQRIVWSLIYTFFMTI